MIAWRSAGLFGVVALLGACEPIVVVVAGDAGPHDGATEYSDASAGACTACAPVPLLMDNFGMGISNAWLPITGCAPGQTAGADKLVLSATYGQCAGIQSADLTLADGEVVARIASFLDVGTAAFAQLVLEVAGDGDSGVRLVATRDTIAFDRFENGKGYSGTRHSLSREDYAFWRIRFARTDDDARLNVWAEVSRDGAGWGRLEAPSTVPAGKRHIALKVDNSAGVATDPLATAQIDEVQVTAAPSSGWCPTSCLTDDFGGDALGPQWQLYGDATGGVALAGSELVITLAGAKELVEKDRSRGVVSRPRYDLSDSVLEFKLGDPSFIEGGGVGEFHVLVRSDNLTYTAYSELLTETGNRLRQVVVGGADVTDDRHDVPAPVRRVRVSGGDGKLRWDTSVDGANWMPVLVNDAPFDLRSVSVTAFGFVPAGTVGTMPIEAHLAGVNAE